MMPRAIAIVGASTHLGALIMMELESAMPDIQLVALDSYPLLRPVRHVSAYRMAPNRTGTILTIEDIPEVLQFKAWDMVLDNRQLTMADAPDVLNLESVDAIVHVGSHYDRGGWEQFIADAHHWRQACLLAEVRQMVYLSDVRVYGMSPDNPVPLTERATTHPDAAHRALLDAEGSLLDGSGDAPSGNGTNIAVLRSAISVGTGGSSPAADEILWPAIAAMRKGAVPLQLIHQQDLVRATIHAVVHQMHGLYNVASKGVVGSQTVREMCKSVNWSRTLKGKHSGSAPARRLTRQPLIMSDAKFRQAARFEPKYSSEQAARAHCHSYLLGSGG